MGFMFGRVFLLEDFYPDGFSQWDSCLAVLLSYSTSKYNYITPDNILVIGITNIHLSCYYPEEETCGLSVNPVLILYVCDGHDLHWNTRTCTCQNGIKSQEHILTSCPLSQHLWDSYNLYLQSTLELFNCYDNDELNHTAEYYIKTLSLYRTWY